MPAIVSEYKKSLRESGLSPAQVDMIWDFYVTKSVAKSSGQKRSAADYAGGKRPQLPLQEMLTAAGFEDRVKILMCNSIAETLKLLELEPTQKQMNEKGEKITVEVELDIDTPRMVCIQEYTISDENEPVGKIGKAECILTHIRNSFAHAQTYFFDNGFVLLEDRDTRGAVTARIMMRRNALLDWIGIIDKEHRFYNI